MTAETDPSGRSSRTPTLSGAPIAYGRTAEIFAWGEEQVLKLFYDWFSLEDIEYEARIGRAVHASGAPAPAVGELVQVSGRNGLLYQRINGENMFEHLQRKPWRVLACARQTATLLTALHRSTLAMELPDQRGRLEHKLHQAQALPDAVRIKALAALERLPDGNSICHGDLHPGNILLTPAGGTIIDWIDATRGNPLADLARSTILALGAAATSQVPNPALKVFVRLFQAAVVREYFRREPGGEAVYRRWLPVVAAARLSEQIPELEVWLLSQAQAGL
jgi:aminoglycoside phosphotransferase (APT) family kinase protein